MVKKALPRSINVPTKTQLAPGISGDGKSMIFLTDYTKSGKLELRYAYMTGPDSWSTPEEIPVINANRKHHFRTGFNLSFDGKTIFFTSRMSDGIGNYDIWYTTRTPTGWSTPRNLGKPVNSIENDGSPSISSDGRYLYFTRCGKMSNKGVNDCKIMVAERRNETYWNEPVALPGKINTGQAMFPKIMADGKMLIYTLPQNGNSDKYEFYFSRKENEHWSQPEALAPLNQENTAPYISMPWSGNIMFLSLLREDGGDICMVKIPEKYQPGKVMLLQGKITDKTEGHPLNAFVQIYDKGQGELLHFAKPDKNGEYFLVIPAGRNYDLAVNVIGNHYTYYSGKLDLDTLKSSKNQNMDFSLEELKPGTTMALNNIYFNEFTELDESSLHELRRLFKLLKDNSDLYFEIRAYITGKKLDSMSYSVADTIFNTYVETDSAHVDEPRHKADQAYRQAKAVVDFLVSKGIARGRLTARGCIKDEKGVSDFNDLLQGIELELEVLEKTADP